MAKGYVCEVPAMNGMGIDGRDACIFYSEVSRKWYIALKGEDYSRSGMPYYLNNLAKWDTFVGSMEFRSLQDAIICAINCRDPDIIPIPYDEIDQSEGENLDNYPLFT